MSTEVTPARLKRKLRNKELLSAAKKMQEALPDMVDTLVEDFKDENATVKERVGIANYFSRITAQRELIAKSKGLSKLKEQVQAPQTIVNMTVYGNLTMEERIKRIQAEVSNIPLIQPVQAQALPEPVERNVLDLTPQPDVRVESVPDRPAQSVPERSLTERADDL